MLPFDVNNTSPLPKLTISFLDIGWPLISIILKPSVSFAPIFFDERSRKVSIDSREVELGDTFFKGVGEIGKECVRRSSILSEYGNLSKIAIFGF